MLQLPSQRLVPDVDDIIDPADTRLAIVRGLEQARGKRVERPWRKHGNMPV